MRAKLFVAGFAIAACVITSSCKKTYTCYCKNYGSGQIGEFILQQKMTRGKALKACTHNNDYVANGYSCGLE